MAKSLLSKALSERAPQYSQADIAQLLGISTGALSNKLNDKSELTLSEAYEIAKILGTTIDVVHFLVA